MTDAKLLSDFLETRSTEALNTLVRRYIDLVYSTACRIVGNPDLAQDVSQAAFLVLARKAATIDPATLPGWLVNTTRLSAREAIRSAATRAKYEARAAQLRTELHHASDEPTADQLTPLLDDALAQLPPEDRNAVTLRFLTGMSFVQVGAALNITEEAARKRVQRALLKLRRILLKQHIAPTVAGLTFVLAANQANAAPAAIISSCLTVTPAGASLAQKVIAVMNLAKLKIAASVAAAAVAFAAGITVTIYAATPVAAPPSAKSEPKPAAAAPSDTATGNIQLRFTETSPLNTLDTYLARNDLVDQVKSKSIGDLDPDQSKWLPDISQFTFDAFVPASYNPKTPHGLVVWTGVADMPAPWQAVFARHKLIAIPAIHQVDLQNGQIQDFRLVSFPVDIVHNMKKRFNLDPTRIYIAGFSAGGSRAAAILRCYNDVFSGALCLNGGVFHQNYNHSPNTDDGPWESTTKSPWPFWKADNFDQLKKDLKIVELRGEIDHVTWTAEEGRVDCQALVLDGFQHITYLEVPRGQHVPPPADWFEKTVVALEAPPQTPPATAPTNDAHPTRFQILQARRLYLSGLSEFDQIARLDPAVKKRFERMQIYDRFVQKQKAAARPYLEQVIKDFPTSPAAKDAKDLLEKIGTPQ